MMDRRAFLKRLGIGLAVAPAVVSSLLASVAQAAAPLPLDEWPLGLMDAIASSSVHELSTRTVAEWDARVYGRSGGQLKYSALRRADRRLRGLC